MVKAEVTAEIDEPGGGSASRPGSARPSSSSKRVAAGRSRFPSGHRETLQAPANKAGGGGREGKAASRGRGQNSAGCQPASPPPTRHPPQQQQQPPRRARQTWSRRTRPIRRPPPASGSPAWIKGTGTCLLQEGEAEGGARGRAGERGSWLLFVVALRPSPPPPTMPCKIIVRKASEKNGQIGRNLCCCGGRWWWWWRWGGGGV